MRKQYNIIMCALALVLGGHTIKAGAQGVVYTAEQCRQMALEHNARIKNAKNDIGGAEQARKEAFTNYFPTVSATGIGFNANKDMAKMVLAPGMEMSMMKDGITAGVTAVQPVFAGGRIVNGNKLAKVGVEVSRLQLEQVENEVELTAERYFWQVVTLQEKLKTVEAVDTMLLSLCKDVEVSVDAGVTTRNDLLQVKLRRNEIAVARMNLESGISVSKMLLAQYIGAEGTGYSLSSPITPGELPASPLELYRSPEASLHVTPEYRLLEKNVEANRLQQKLAVGKQMPSVGVGAGYMYHNVMGCSRSFGVVFASVTVPISGWWGGSHAIKKQKLQVRNAENDMQDKSQLLVIRMEKAWNDVQDAYKQIGIARQSIEQVEENLRLNNDYYKAGTSTMSDLLDAQTLYRRSCDGYVEACSAYRIKALEYLQTTGR